MRNKFEREMSELEAEMLKMSKFVVNVINDAMKALRTGDRELARSIYENDHVANELELTIERQSMRILLSEQPVAGDLRTISTALKMITDMERISDQGADISEILTHIPTDEKGPDILYTMADKCVIMVSKAMDAFIGRDLELARAVSDADSEIDRRNHARNAEGKRHTPRSGIRFSGRDDKVYLKGDFKARVESCLKQKLHRVQAV